ncbi:unnamed protein product [Arctia plantaginis]|uniref:C2H2-type domain-containing protein n=1 Tax=Arctia plantaginis TaxID=874455 RepID=A0A8S0ZHS4_ARCPL|nr:unnamed protein product [Arctia plantaginis]
MQKWRRFVKIKVHDFEEQTKSEMDAKRDALKGNPIAATSYNFVGDILTCSQCSQTFIHKFGYCSHQRAHARADHPSLPANN